MGEATMTKATVIHVSEMREGDVYVGRAVPRRGCRTSLFANPFKIGMHSHDAARLIEDLPGTRDGDSITFPERLGRSDVIRLYRFWFERLPALQDRARHELSGKRLACWCRHEGEARTEANACHADVLAELVNTPTP